MDASAAGSAMNYQCNGANWVCKVVVNPDDASEIQNPHEFSVEAFVVTADTVHDIADNPDEFSHMAFTAGFFFGGVAHSQCSAKLPETRIYSIEVTVYHRVFGSHHPTAACVGGAVTKGPFVNIGNVVFTNAAHVPAAYDTQSNLEFLQADSKELKVHLTLECKRHQDGRSERNVVAVACVVSEQMLLRLTSNMIATKRLTSYEHLPEACRAILSNEVE